MRWKLTKLLFSTNSRLCTLRSRFWTSLKNQKKNAQLKVKRYLAGIEYGRKQSAIRNRYLNQRYWGENLTSKQKRRMRKQNAKWRKRIRGA